ncbi:MAG: NUDIX domain-containing protein [Patescibacteria group bacterium]
MENSQHITKVGVGVMIFKNGKVLMSKRKGSHGAGEYSFPGGHLEYMESFEECAIRETKEETGIEIKNLQFLYLTNAKQYAPKHYVHLTMTAEWESGEPQVIEPEKTEGWDWYDLDSIPEPMFDLCKLSFDAYKNNKKYYV